MQSQCISDQLPDWSTYAVEPAHLGERFRFSARPTPAKVARLRNGHPVCPAMLEKVIDAVLATTRAYQAGRPLKCWRFFGRTVWNQLKHDEKCRIGCCMVDIARHPDSPIGLQDRPKGRSHRYVIRPEWVQRWVKPVLASEVQFATKA